MKIDKFIENVIQFVKNKPFIRNIRLMDTCFIFLILILIHKQFQNIKFIYESNIIIINLSFLLIIFFIWVWNRSKIDKSNMLSSMSIIFAVFFFLAQSAYNDDSKIKLLSSVNFYNCSVAEGILTLKSKANLSENFIINHFIFQIYIDNSDLLFRKLGKEPTLSILKSAHVMSGANSLIDTVQIINAQGVNQTSVNSLYSQNYHINMYNLQIMEIASSTRDVICRNYF